MKKILKRNSIAHITGNMVREDALRRAEEHLSHAVDVAKAGGVTLAELTETLNLLYGDETL